MPDTVLPIGPDRPWLAPLAGFSDLAFRLLCREYGAAAACTEMVSAKGLVYKSPGTWPLLSTCPQDTPLVVQLFGSEPEFMARAMDMCLERGFTLFDLNCGCSVPKVVKTGSGAALLKEPGRLLDVARTMLRLAGWGRVGFKLRLGWAAGEEIYLDVARDLEGAGAGWITLHPRFSRQGFSGTARWECLARLKEVVGVPVLGSGDLLTAEDGRECLRQTGIDGVMFARGALRDPAVFARFLDREASSGGAALARLVRRHAELARAHSDERQALLKMRTVVPGYLKGVPGTRALRKVLTTCSSWEMLEEIVSALESAGIEAPA